MITTDVLPIIQSLASLASIIVAFYSLYSVISLRKQVDLMERQTLLHRSETYPIIDIENIQVKENEIEVTLKNKGKGAAFFIGLGMQFHPIIPLKNQWEFVNKINIIEEGEARKIYPRSHVIFLRNQNGHNRLLSSESDTFKGKISFLFSYKKNKDLDSGTWKYFDDFKTLMNLNNIHFVAVMTDVVFKDLSESITESEAMYSIIVNLQKHKSMEEAIKDNIPFSQRTLSWENEAEWMDRELYKKGKSPRGFLKSK